MLYSKQALRLCLFSLFLITLPSCNPLGDAQGKKDATKAPDKAEPAIKKNNVHGAVKEIGTENEFTSLLGSGKPVIAKFWATWCPPCQRMKPIFAAISSNYSDKAHFVSLEHGNKDLAKLFEKHVKQGFPTFVYFDGEGNVVETHPGGYDQAELDKAVSDFIQKNS